MRKAIINIVVICLICIPLWMFLCYKSLPFIYFYWGEEVAQHIYSDEIEWMNGKSMKEIEARFGPVDNNYYGYKQYYLAECKFYTFGHYGESDRVWYVPHSEYDSRKCNEDCVFSFARNFQPRWILGNLILSLLFFCGAPMIFAWLTRNYHCKPTPTP